MYKWELRVANLTRRDYGAPTQFIQHLAVCPLYPNACSREVLNTSTISATKVVTFEVNIVLK